MKTKIIAVTGGIGSGQSTVSRCFEKLECKVINADQVAKQIVDTNADVQDQLRKEFGNEIFDKNQILIRDKMAQIVFSDKNRIQRLNKIVHPALIAELILQIENAIEQNKFKLIIIDAALVYELAMERFFDKVIVVTARKDVRIKRVQQRDKLTRTQIIDRIQNQIDLSEKAKWADYVIQNNGSLEYLEKNVQKIFNDLTKDQSKKRYYKRKSRQH
ncbi:MAG: dephospho-CoA kinase [Calditrichaeota bacterium]|nr:dephospho-CoA kinase [Calditrichota bacterium]